MPRFDMAPEEVLAILRAAVSRPADPRLPAVLQAFRLDWLVIARRRYRDVLAQFDDVAQEAALRLVSPERLARLTCAGKLVPWARAIFVNATLDAIRELRLERSLRVDLNDHDRTSGDESPGDRLPHGGLDPEALCVYRERLRIVERLMADLEVPRLKFRDGLSDKEIAARCDSSRDAVAGQLKRFRKAVRAAVGDADSP
jgi:RNA polymerase sigma factor (sigma-70 family)